MRSWVVELARQLGDLVGVTASTRSSISSSESSGTSNSIAARQPPIRAAGRLEPEHHPALDVLLGALELVVGDALVAEPRELAADDLAGLGDVLGAGADVHRDDAAVDELLRVGADRVGEPALLADLAEEPRGHRAAEDRVERRASAKRRSSPRAIPGPPKQMWYCSVSFG